MLNQLNYWLGINRKAGKNFIDDRYWVYNSYSDWKAKDFPYWSEKTIQRTFTRLENKGVVVSANYNKLGIDKTKWYTIDTEKLQELVDEFNSDEDKMTNRQDNMTDRQDKMTCREGQCDRPLPEITTENINRDYNSEITGEVHTSVFEKQTARVTRQNMQAKKEDMLNRLFAICDNNIENKTVGEAVKNAFRRYMNLYETYFCKVHPILTDRSLTNVCLSLSNVTDAEHNHFEWTDVYLADETGFTGLDRMVNEHFRRTHRGQTNYSITHFAKSDYLLQLAQGLIEY